MRHSAVILVTRVGPPATPTGRTRASSGDGTPIPPTPIRVRITRDSPLVPQIYFYMSYFRTTLAKFKKEVVKDGRSLEPFSVICEYDGFASKRCKGYDKKNASYYSSDELIGTVSSAILELYRVFNAMAKAHRSKYGLTDSKRDEKNTPLEYRAAIERLVKKS
ncbi:hypothetical protein N7474_003599 [Penicillium riverlandense]|uniref:uncharacterized protein n=1 Tax=Penicillium riverlandense TaxID=1903569 RepID=UPI00254785A3|nr:uncharacterized protein N7474_003599 [Penicillium riverlandense]KAJ5818008.1 hypothetical protein N7474_003599 [Penicillium riverlandense]